MKKEFNEYRRIAKGLLGMSSLWLGNDHLVFVKGFGFLLPFTEEYHRYRYRDIQAITIEKTSRIGLGILFFLGFAAAAGLSALVIFYQGDEPLGTGGVISLSISTAVAFSLLLLFLRHLILGPTCRCEIQTSLKRERLRPLRRYHSTQERVREISEKVREAQAELLSSGNLTVKESQVAMESGSGLKVPALVVPTFIGYAVIALLALAALHLESVFVTGLTMTLTSLGSVLLTSALVSCVRVKTPESIRVALWVLLGILFLLVAVAAVFFVYVARGGPEYTLGISGPLEAFSGIASLGGPVFYWTFLGLVLGVFGVSFCGIFQAMKWKSRSQGAGSPIESDPDADEGGSEE